MTERPKSVPLTEQLAVRDAYFPWDLLTRQEADVLHDKLTPRTGLISRTVDRLFARHHPNQNPWRLISEDRASELDGILRLKFPRDLLTKEEKKQVNDYIAGTLSATSGCVSPSPWEAKLDQGRMEQLLEEARDRSMIPYDKPADK